MFAYKNRLTAKLIPALAFALLAFSLAPSTTNAATVQTWQCGYPNPADITATLDEAGTLTISGTGAMSSYSSGGTITTAPWGASSASITGIIIKEGVTTVGPYAFYQFTNLSSVSLPSSLTGIGFDAFAGDSNLSGPLMIPANVTSIDSAAFANMSKLTAFDIAPGNTAYRAIDGVLFNAAGTILVAYPCGHAGATYAVPDNVSMISAYAFAYGTLSTVILPDSITTIDVYAFYNSALTSITLPDGVTSVGFNAFTGCSKLQTVTILNSTPPSATAFAYLNLNTMSLVVLPQVIDVYKNDAFWSGFGSITAYEGAYFAVSSDSASIPYYGGSCDISINDNPAVAWSASSDQPWATLSQSSGIGDATVTLTVASNTAKSPSRAATITVTLGGIDKKITVWQDAYLSVRENTLAAITVSSEQWNNLLTPTSTGYPAELINISKTVYNKFKDDFDFIFFVLDAENSNEGIATLGFAGNTTHVNTTVQGIGIGSGNYHDSRYGSAGKLQSVIYLSSPAGINGTAEHEICHNWGANICPTYDLDNFSCNPHWGVSNAGGQLGGFRYVRVVEQNSGGVPGKTKYEGCVRSDERNPDGSFKYAGFLPNTTFAGQPYSDIELYLMGMKPAQELRDNNFHLDVYSGNSPDPSGPYYWCSTNVTSYTIDDIIAQNGARVPDFATSQKHFKILVVAISKEGATTNNHDAIIRDIRWFSGPIDDTSNPVNLNFQQATYGVGSLEMGDLGASLIAADIVAQPVDQGVSTGQNATFSVVAGGDPAPAMQWQVSTDNGGTWNNINNDSTYSGATTDTLIITDATLALSGNLYRCAATNIHESAISDPATLTVSSTTAFFTQPVDQSATTGQDVTFTIAAIGGPTLALQWQSSPDGATWTDIPGATTATLTLNAVTNDMDGTYYRCIAAGSLGAATSNAARLTINAIPSITMQPMVQTVTPGENVTFAIAATGNMLTYQWACYPNGSGVGTWISGATDATLTLYAVTDDMDGTRYTCVVTNPLGKATSTSVRLTVSTDPVAPRVTEPQSANQTTTAGQNVTFLVGVSGNPSPTLQWQSSPDGMTWTDISGATALTLTLNAVTVTMNGMQYRCHATNSAGGAYNYPYITLTVIGAPLITTQPADQSTTAGQTATLTATATGNPAPTYQWQKNGTDIPGATSASYTITNAQQTDAGSYTVVVTNSLGSVTSNAATLTVTAAPPAYTTITITLDPQNGAVSPTTTTATQNSPYGTLPTPTRDGYTFAGWWTSANGAGTQILATTTVPATATNQTLYANWTPITPPPPVYTTITITLNPDGGAVSPTTTTATQNSPYGTLPTPTRDGYTFGGWWTSANGTGTQIIATTTVPANATNQTLYAKWTENVTPPPPDTPVLTVDKITLALAQPALSPATFDITSNIDWRTRVDSGTASTWLAVNPITGSGNSSATATTISVNSTGAPRTASIIVTGSGITRTLIATQAATNATGLAPTGAALPAGATLTLTTTDPNTSAAPPVTRAYTVVAGNKLTTTDDHGTVTLAYEYTATGATGTLVIPDLDAVYSLNFTNATTGTLTLYTFDADGPYELTGTFTYAPPAAPTYALTVTNGTGTGAYAANATVTITANPAPTGQAFDCWTTTTAGITFANATNATTTLTMPATAATITATYKDQTTTGGGNNNNSNNSGGGGGGGGGAPSLLYLAAAVALLASRAKRR